jgi:PAS domain S-box-containing protein
MMDAEDRAGPQLPDGASIDRFRELAESVPHLVWSARSDGTVDYCNSYVSRFAPTVGDGTGTSRWEAIVHDEDRPGAIQAWERAKATGTEYERAHRLLMRDGSWRWHLSRARPVRDAAGRITGWFGTATDIHELHEAEEARRAASETFRHLVEDSPFGIYVVDADFRLVQISAGAQKVFQSVRPLIGRDFAEVLRILWVEPFASEAIGRFRHTLATGEPYRSPSTVEHRRDIGAVEAYDWKIDRITLPDSRYGVVCHFYDLSERQRYEEALRESERRARNIVESISDGFVTIDRDWRITYINHKAREIARPLVGDAADDLVGRSFLDSIPPTPGTPFLMAYLKAFEEGVPVSVEDYYRPLDTWLDVRCYPTANGLAIHVLDVGPRKRAEEALRQSEERFRAMTDNLPLIVWMRDADGAIEFVNQTFCDYFSTRNDDVVEGRWTLPLHPEDTAYIEAFHECVRARRRFHGEARVRRGDGEWRWLETWANPRFDSHGEFLGHIGTSADITDRKRTEEVRQLLVLELNHRVKNTLSVVQAIAHQSFRTGRSTVEQRDAFEGRLRALSEAHDVLTRANWQEGSLAELVEGARRSCGVDPARLQAHGDDVMLAPQRAVTIAMALHELCTNAIKYGALSGPDGRVTVEWQVTGEPRRFRLVWTERGGPPVSPPGRRGFGTRMLERALAADLGASVAIDFAPEGMTCTIEASLPSGNRG